MKKLTTVTQFAIVSMPVGGAFTHVRDKQGKVIKFKTRKAAENYCSKNGTGYVEIKHTFYR